MKRAARPAALFLALFLLFAGGCAPVPPEETWALTETFDPLQDPIFDVLSGALHRSSSLAVQPPAEGANVPFDQMVYNRPDADGLEARLMEIADLVRDARTGAEEAVALLNEAGVLWDNYLTALNLALVHHDINTQDTYWAGEYGYCTANQGRLSIAFAYVQGSAAAYKENASKTTVQADAFDQNRYIMLQAQEQALVSEYLTILNSATVVYGGEQITRSDAHSQEAADAWLAAYAPRLGEIYVALVRIRNGMAQCFGYENYLEYSFSMKDYTPEMVNALLEALRMYYAPLAPQAVGLSRSPDVRVEATQAISFMRTIFTSMDSQLLESLNLMESCRLSSLAATPEKAQGAFTTYFADYGEPFICMQYDGTYTSFSTLLHEFGHFNEMYQNGAAAAESADTSEIFSTALVLLASDRFADVLPPAQAAACQQREINEILLTSLEQGALLQIEMQAYTLPDSQLSPQTVSQIAEDAFAAMGFSEGAPALSYLQTPHLYEMPFYVLSYIVSGNVAMQIWEESAADPAGGYSLYNTLLAQAASPDAGFLGTVTAAGLVSPFDVGEIARQAGIFSMQFSAQDTPLPEEESREGAAA